MTHYQLEFGGGLGDVFYQLYERGAYNVLRDLQPEDTADVILVAANPFVKELFQWHPKAAQITVRDFGYWMVQDDAKMRQQHKLPPSGSNWALPVKDTRVEYHVAEEENKLLREFEEHFSPYIVLSLSAGLPDRNIPQELVMETILPVIRKALPEHTLVYVGRTYERFGRHEWVPPGIVSLLDKLSVPATARLVQKAAGLVTAHSALNLLAWRERVPQLLLYPQDVLDRHARNGRYDQWMFGATFPETVHGLFSQCTPEHVEQFCRRVR